MRRAMLRRQAIQLAAAIPFSITAYSCLSRPAAAQSAEQPLNSGAISSTAQASGTQLPTIVVESPKPTPPSNPPKNKTAKEPPKAASAATSQLPPQSTPDAAVDGAPSASVGGVGSWQSDGIERTTRSDTQGKGFQRESSSVGTKFDTPIFETPFSVYAVPSDVLQAQAATRLEEALRNVSGVQQAFNFGGGGQNFIIRGFQLSAGTSNLIYRDGLPQNALQLDLANVEEIQVLKGSSGGLYGRLEPGGLVNYVIKKPLPVARASVEQEFGSYGWARTVGDATGPVTADGSVRYRGIVAFQDNNSFRDEVENRRFLISPSLSWDITPSTELYVNYEHSNFDYVLDGGLPSLGAAPANVPISRWYGLLGLPISNRESDLVDVHLTHKLADGWTAKARGAYSKVQSHFFDSEPAQFNELDPTRVDLFLAGPYDDSNRTWFGELSLTGETQLAYWLKNRAYVGGEVYDFESRQLYANAFSGFPPQFDSLDIFSPVYQSLRDLPAFPKNNIFNPGDSWKAVTYQNEVTVLDRLHLLAGGRYEVARETSSFCSPNDVLDPVCPAENAASNEAVARPFTQRYGASYEITPQLAAYGSYAESFSTSGFGRLADRSIAAPSEGVQYEAGLKARLFGGNLQATLAWFDITQSNISVPIPGNAGFVEQIGEANSRGFELDVAGRITDRLQLIANYAYTDTEVTNDVDEDGGPGFTGNHLPNVGLHSGALWLQYDLGAGLSVGAGVAAVDERFANPQNGVVLPAYARVDASLSYKFDTALGKALAQVNVSNLLDETYYLSGNNTGTALATITPGAPRTFIGSLKVEF